MQDLFINDQLQIVVFTSPYDCLNGQEEQKLFSQLMAFKVEGYSKVHSKKVLPVDTSDFIGTHIVVLDKRSRESKVLMAYKSVSLRQCQRFNLEFPFLTILKKANNPICLREMENVVNNCHANDEDLSYDSGWTIDPGIRENKPLQNALKEIVTMFVIKHHDEFDIKNWVTFGICKVKTDQFFLRMGLSEISQRPIIQHPYLDYTDARAVICFNQQYSAYTIETAKQYESLWDNKILYGMPDSGSERKAS